MHKRITVVAEIFSKTWAIYPGYVEANLPLIIDLATGKIPHQDFSVEQAASLPYAQLPNSTNGNTASLSEAEPASVAIIPLSGPLMKADQVCGPRGTASIGQYIQEAGANPNISAIVLVIDSPGGTVDGTTTLMEIIKASNKPIVGFVDGMMCSAAIWIASACDEIIASGQTDIIGSIGTMMSFADLKPKLEAAGIILHDVYASLSSAKNIEFRAARDGDYKPLIENILDPVNTVFHEDIKTNRGAKLNLTNKSVFDGSVMYSDTAVKAGLIDSIGNFESAITRASQLSKTNSIKTKSLMKFKLTNALAALSAFFGVDTSKGDVDVEATSEQLTELNSKIAATATLEASISTLTDQLKTATENATALSTQLATAKTDLLTATTEVARLRTPLVIPVAPVNTQGDALLENQPAKNKPPLSSVDIEARVQYAKEKLLKSEG